MLIWYAGDEYPLPHAYSRGRHMPVLIVKFRPFDEWRNTFDFVRFQEGRHTMNTRDYFLYFDDFADIHFISLDIFASSASYSALAGQYDFSLLYSRRLASDINIFSASLFIASRPRLALLLSLYFSSFAISSFSKPFSALRFTALCHLYPTSLAEAMPILYAGQNFDTRHAS